jgi:NlpE-like protein
MNSLASMCLCLLLLSVLTGCIYPQATPTLPPPWYPAENEAGDPIFAVFSNRVPCAECDLPLGPSSKIKVELVLYADAETQEPTTYALARVYPGADSPADRLETYGTWTVGQGTATDSSATVYQLDANSPEEFRSYLVLSDNILFILDLEGNPRVGDGFYSYTLNRTR